VNPQLNEHFQSDSIIGAALITAARLKSTINNFNLIVVRAYWLASLSPHRRDNEDKEKTRFGESEERQRTELTI
jgi:hypothetical protein